MYNYNFYNNGQKVIAVSSYAGRTVRGVARCAENDEFDLEKGQALASARCNLKIAEKRQKRAERKFLEAKEMEEKAKAHTKEMRKYFRDSNIALEEAEDLLYDILDDM